MLKLKACEFKLTNKQACCGRSEGQEFSVFLRCDAVEYDRQLLMFRGTHASTMKIGAAGSSETL
jgi:hypothetical protein